MTIRSFGFGLEVVTPGKVTTKANEVNGYLRFLNEQMIEDASRLGNDFFADWTSFFNQWQVFYSTEIQTPRLFLRTMGARLTEVEGWESDGRRWQDERDKRLSAAPPVVTTRVPPVVQKTPPPVVKAPPPVVTRPPPVVVTKPPDPVPAPPPRKGIGMGGAAVLGTIGIVGALLLVRSR